MAYNTKFLRREISENGAVECTIERNDYVPNEFHFYPLEGGGCVYAKEEVGIAQTLSEFLNADPRTHRDGVVFNCKNITKEERDLLWSLGFRGNY